MTAVDTINRIMEVEPAPITVTLKCPDDFAVDAKVLDPGDIDLTEAGTTWQVIYNGSVFVPSDGTITVNADDSTQLDIPSGAEDGDIAVISIYK